VSTRTLTRTALGALATCAALAGPARATTTATITPSLTPDRLGARAALTFAIDYAGGSLGVPSPVRRSVLRLPAGLRLEIPTLSSCTAARLRAGGEHSCPAQSKIGSGRALAAVHVGTLTLTEPVALWAFLGPLRDLQPTFEILARGYSPLDERLLFSGTALPDKPPFGEQLVLSIPPIPSLPLEPDVSIVTFSLTIGTSRKPRAHGASTVVVPSSCPPGGFPFAAEFTYADGSSGTALATSACPL
jgi:hypothetical protein